MTARRLFLGLLFVSVLVLLMLSVSWGVATLSDPTEPAIAAFGAVVKDVFLEYVRLAVAALAALLGAQVAGGLAVNYLRLKKGESPTDITVF